MLPLTAAAGFAISSILFKRIGAEGAVLQVVAWQLLLGGLPLLALSAFFEPQVIDWTATFVGLLLFLSLIGTALTTAVWYWLVQRDEVGRLSIALFLVPAVGLGLAVSLFNEPLAVPEVVGVGLVLAALAGIVLEDTRAHSPD
jgi:probable blue pigment (indigoidine) exporter